MAKKKSKKGKGYYATYAANNTAVVNRKAKLARHLKKHPNDVQSKKNFVGTKRTASGTKGNYPEAKAWVYDKAGNKYLMPSFTPDYLKKK